jgi:hypothetical protein
MTHFLSRLLEENRADLLKKAGVVSFRAWPGIEKQQTHMRR